MTIIIGGLAGDRDIILDLGSSDDGSTYTTIRLPLEVAIYETSKTVPVLGTAASIEGWEWDRALQISDSTEQFRYNTFTGAVPEITKIGTIVTDWTSGLIEGIEFDSLTTRYLPIIHIGSYSFSSSPRTLYSDYSFTSYIEPSYTTDDEDLVSFVTNDLFPLPEDYRLSTIRVYSLKRSPSLHSEIVEEYNLVDAWTDDAYFHQYQIINNTVVLDRRAVREYGIDPTLATYELITEHGIEVARGTSSAQDFFLDYFPVVPSTIKAFIVYDDMTIERWSFVDNFDFSFDVDAVLVLNNDLGVISCGGATFDSLTLQEDISDTETDIVFYTTKNIDGYPLRGIVHIDGETIIYTDRSHTTLRNCIRGYNTTIATSHSRGSVIEFERRGYPLTSDARLFVYYQSTNRVDCEITDYQFRKGEPDCRPSKNITASKIVEISSKIRDLASLILEIDRPSLGGNRFGPLFFGNDTAKLTATALDSRENPVEDLEITIEILDPIIGLLDGESTSISKISNDDGKIFAFYNAPVDLDSFSTTYDSVQYSSGSTIFEVPGIDNQTTLTSIYIYQILKQDPSIGSVGERHPISSYSSVTSRPSAAAVAVLSVEPVIDYTNGIGYFIDTFTGDVYTRGIFQQDGASIFIDEDLPAPCSNVFLLTADAITWDTTLLNGIPVILYTFDSGAQHPITGSNGAYMPITASAVSGEMVTFPYIFPEPAPDDIDSNLGGYMIIAPNNVSFRASAIDPYSGEIIYSNIVSLSIELPNYLVGVDRSGALPIPKGFNLGTLEEDIGAGLGGANFITINSVGGLFGLQIRFAS